MSSNERCSFVRVVASFSLLLSFVGAFSCEREVKVKPKGNAPPRIHAIRILPPNPHRDSQLNLILQSEDPDRDPVTYRYIWMKNNEEISDENKDNLNSGNFRKGDFIRVKVSPSDGKAEGEPFLSAPVMILNSPPVMEEVLIEPGRAYATDQLKVQIRSSDVDGDSVYYAYQWSRNGQVLGEERTEVLEKGRVKKGDRIGVIVTPDDRESQGISKKSEPITILNSPPTIVSSPPTSADGNQYIYQVKAHDPDGDPVSFTLKSAPRGMEINKEKGLIRWIVEPKDKGTHSVEIEGSDEEGAKSIQRFLLNVEIR